MIWCQPTAIILCASQTCWGAEFIPAPPSHLCPLCSSAPKLASVSPAAVSSPHCGALGKGGGLCLLRGGMLSAPWVDLPYHGRASSLGEMLLRGGPVWMQWVPSLCLQDGDGDLAGAEECGQEGSSAPSLPAHSWL